MTPPPDDTDSRDESATFYGERYFAKRSVARSAKVMACSIARDLAPTSVLDVGCGTGELLEALAREGVRGMGFDFAPAALRICHEKGLHVLPLDLGRDPLPRRRTFDAAISLEVAEHLPAERADVYVQLLCDASSCVIFTAAPPGQGGVGHLNEQPKAYWLERFGSLGFRLDQALSQHWSAEWSEQQTKPWYHLNLMVLRRGE